MRSTKETYNTRILNAKLVKSEGNYRFGSIPAILPVPPAKLCLTIISAAAAAANLSFCLLLSLRYLSASGRIRRIRRMMSSLGSACAAFLFSSFAFFIVPRFLLRSTVLWRRVGKPTRPAAPPNVCPPAIAGGALKRLLRFCSCCRAAVADAIDSDVRMRSSVASK
jgi:hypothetical protein